MALVGRTQELDVLAAALDAARSGLGAAVLVHGEAGVGKTALLLEATRAASDFQVVHSTAPETDIELAYGGLKRLLAPFAAELDQLAAQPRDVLRGAFGLSSRSHGDRHVVGAAALALLSHVAQARPVVCVVDDAQWLDGESRDALVLIARRLGADRVAVLFGVRDPVHEAHWPADLRRAAVLGLTEAEAGQLAESVAVRAIDPRHARRIAIQSRGVPMAIIEMTASLDWGADDQPVPRELPLSRRIEEHLLHRARSLGPGAQELLRVAAVDETGDTAIVLAAATVLGVDSEAADAVADAGLVDFWPTVQFRHPLVRSAIRNSASDEDRRRAHGALAEVSSDPQRRESRVWHRSAAASTTDDAVAADLVELAEGASRRGAHTTAGALLARAAELTSDGSTRVERVVAAATAYVAGGAGARASELLMRSAPLFVRDVDRARAVRLRGLVRFDVGEVKGTVPMLIDAARTFYEFDRCEARATLLLAFAAARPNGRFALPGEGAIAVCAAAKAMPRDMAAEPGAVDLLLDGLAALFLDGHRACVPLLADALERLDDLEVVGADGLTRLAMACWAAGAIGDDLKLHAVSDRFVRFAREQGTVVGLAHGLLYSGMSELLSGSLRTARAHFDERSELMRAVGSAVDVGVMISSAWAGREAETRAEARIVSEFATERGYGWMLFFVEYSLCVLELGLGNYRAALDTALRNYDESPFLALTSFPDVIEAAVRCRERPAAERALDELDARALPNQTRLALGLLARCRALVADDVAADKLYVEAIDHLRHSRAQIQVARTQLLYGEWLRRRKRRIDAREQLRAAYDTFTRLGAGAFAERARRELVATGEHTRSRATSVYELTPQERAIAELASTGATNAEIATKLFLSPATVDYHLRKVYRKLGITSRRELATGLASQHEEHAAPRCG